MCYVYKYTFGIVNRTWNIFQMCQVRYWQVTSAPNRTKPNQTLIYIYMYKHLRSFYNPYFFYSNSHYFVILSHSLLVAFSFYRFFSGGSNQVVITCRLKSTGKDWKFWLLFFQSIGHFRMKLVYTNTRQMDRKNETVQCFSVIFGWFQSDRNHLF